MKRVLPEKICKRKKVHREKNQTQKRAQQEKK